MTRDESRPSDWRSLLWWLPPLVLFSAGAATDPERGWWALRTGSHAYSVLQTISGSSFWLGILYVPAMIVFRTALSLHQQTMRWTRRSRRLIFWSILLFILITAGLTRSFAIPMICCGLVAAYLIVWPYLRNRRQAQRGFEVIVRKDSN